MTLESVPVVDIGPFIGGDIGQNQRVARALAAACEEIGFFTIVGHGVPEALIEETRARALEFFAQDAAAKRAIARPASKISRGYSWVGDRGLAYSLGDRTPPDLQE